MGLYELIVFAHVAAAFALLSGSVVASPAVRAAVRRARTSQDVRAFVSIGRPLAVLEPVSAVIVLVSGIYLTSVANFWALGWVQVATAFWIVNAAVAGAMVKPAIDRIAAAAATAADGPVTGQLDALRRSPRWAYGGDLLMVNDAAMLYVMVMKPELAGSLIAVAGTILAVMAVRTIGHGFRKPRGAASSVEHGRHATRA